MFLAYALIGSACAASFLEFVPLPRWKARWQKREIIADWHSVYWRRLRLSTSTLLAVAFAWRFQSWPAAIAAASIVWVYLLSMQSDLKCRKIPREPCWYALILGAGFAGLSGKYAFLSFLVTLFAVAIVLVLVVLISMGRLGSGDVRLALAFTPLSAWVGMGPVLIGFILASPIQLILRLLFGKKWKVLGSGMPFGPALGAGIILSVMIFGTPGIVIQ